jgi:uncharacterized membrane protein YphA (DoxX/SURF4 family)
MTGMAGNAIPGRSGISEAADRAQTRLGLAIIRVTIGAMFISVFFENKAKGLYTAAGYSGLINHYIKAGTAPAVWKAVMTLAAQNASAAAPAQAVTEFSLGVLLLLGLLTRPAAAVAFAWLASLWISEWGTAWIWELLVPMMACLGLSIARAGRGWGIDAILARKRPSSPWW